MELTREQVISLLREDCKSCGDHFCNKCQAIYQCGTMHASDLLEADAKRIAELEAQVPKWISVNDRLPEPGITKLIVTVRHEHGNIVDMARYLGPQEGWDLVSWKLWDKNVTHWMPLPEPPKDESEVEDDA